MVHFTEPIPELAIVLSEVETANFTSESSAQIKYGSLLGLHDTTVTFKTKMMNKLASSFTTCNIE